MQLEDIYEHKDTAQARHLLAEEGSSQEKYWQGLADNWDTIIEYLTREGDSENDNTVCSNSI